MAAMSSTEREAQTMMSGCRPGCTLCTAEKRGK